jgi:hypothetical protein
MNKIKKIAYFIVIGLLCFIGGMAFCYYKYVNEYKFFYEIPKFNQRQIEIIKHTYGSAISLLDNPADWFIKDVIENDTNIIIGLSCLSRLQDGANLTGNISSSTFDGYYRIKFNKNYKLITDSISLVKQNP